MLTKSEILKEYAKCLTNPIYAIETYLETKDVTQGGFVPFQLFKRQKEIIRAYEKYRYNLVTKPRQAGISTTTQAYIAAKIAFADPENPEVVLIIANKLNLAKKFLKGIKEYLRQMPRWCWGDAYYGTPENEKKDIFEASNSKVELELPNKCQVIAVATSEDALRGYTPTYLIFDEAAFINNGDEVYTAAMSSCATGGKAILISTPNGMDPLYYKTYEQAKAKKNSYHIIEMRWHEDPRYNKDLKWKKKLDNGEEIIIEEVEFTVESYEEKLRNGFKPTSSWYVGMCETLNNNERRIAQELDVSFLGSGGNVIKDEDIDYHEKNNVMEPKMVYGQENEFWMWEEPEEGHMYVLASDVSRGDGEDTSTIIIIDFTTMRQVFEYQGKIPPDKLGELINKYGTMYNAYSIVDITGGMGVATVLKLMELNYKLLHYDDGSKVISRKKDLEKYIKDDNKIPGFTINSVRLPMIANLEKIIRERGITIRSQRLVNEMKTFVYKNGRPDHMDGYHDDLLMALGMILWVLEYSFKKLQKLESKTKAMLAGWTTSNTKTTALNNSKNLPKSLQPTVINNAPTTNKPNNKSNHLWLFSGMK